MHIANVGKKQRHYAARLVVIPDFWDSLINTIISHGPGTGGHLDAKRFWVVRKSLKSSLIFQLSLVGAPVDKRISEVRCKIYKLNLKAKSLLSEYVQAFVNEILLPIIKLKLHLCFLLKRCVTMVVVEFQEVDHIDKGVTFIGLDSNNYSCRSVSDTTYPVVVEFRLLLVVCLDFKVIRGNQDPDELYE